jgi:hypothetical protein
MAIRHDLVTHVAWQDAGHGDELGTVAVSGLHTDHAWYDGLYRRRRATAGA